MSCIFPKASNYLLPKLRDDNNAIILLLLYDNDDKCPDPWGSFRPINRTIRLRYFHPYAIAASDVSAPPLYTALRLRMDSALKQYYILYGRQ